MLFIINAIEHIWDSFLSWSDCVLYLILCVSESTLKKQVDKEQTTLQQSIHKNSALISEKDLQLENLRSEVRIQFMVVFIYCTQTQITNYVKLDVVCPWRYLLFKCMYSFTGATIAAITLAGVI